MRDGGGGARLHGVCGSEPEGRKSYAKPVGIGEVCLARASAMWSRRIGQVTPPGGGPAATAGGNALGFANTGSQQHGRRTDMHALSYFAPCRLADRDRTEFGSERGRVCASRSATATA